MAGDWIKVECTTPDKPEMVALANALGIDQDAAVGKCLRVWIWADQQSTNGNALSVTESFLDRITYCTGFAAAMKSVGWLVSDGDKLTLPHFDRHNGQTAKTRALTRDRVKASRSKRDECNGGGVTSSLPEIEKRVEKRVEKEEQTQDSVESIVPQVKPKRERAAFQKPTCSEVVAYICEIGATIDAREFVDHYESNGWMVGRNRMKDWKATVRQWQARRKLLNGGMITNGHPRKHESHFPTVEEVFGPQRNAEGGG